MGVVASPGVTAVLASGGETLQRSFISFGALIEPTPVVEKSPTSMLLATVVVTPGTVIGSASGACSEPLWPTMGSTGSTPV